MFASLNDSILPKPREADTVIYILLVWDNWKTKYCTGQGVTSVERTVSLLGHKWTQLNPI